MHTIFVFFALGVEFYVSVVSMLHKKGERYMAGSTEYKNKWQQENRERINLVVPKGYKALLQETATAAGESVNGYIKAAIDQRMARERGVGGASDSDTEHPAAVQ